MCSEVMNILAQNLKNATNKHVKKPVQTQRCRLIRNKETIWSVGNALVAHCSPYTIGL